MNKLSALMLCVILVLTTACSSGSKEYDGGPAEITIWVDDGSTSFISQKQEGMLVPYLRDFTKSKYPNITVNGELVSVYRDGMVDYEATMNLQQSLRTEVVAGGGPDIYIMPAFYRGYTGVEPLFKDVKEAMDNGLFLPLDDYIAESNIINLEEYPSVIMDAGVNDFGRVVMPLSYTFPILLYERDVLAEPDKAYGRFDELMATEDSLLHDSLREYAPQFISSVFSSYGDYDSANVIVTAEEIASVLKAAAPEEEIDFSENILVYDYTPFMWDSVLYQLDRNRDSFNPIIVPNDSDGITAYVTWYAAINANCENPAAAFKVFELLFSEEMQSGSYKPYAYDAAQNSVLRSLGTSDGSKGVSVHPSAFSRPNFVNIMDEYNSKITSVRFPSEMDKVLESACEDIFWEIHSGGKFEDIDFTARSEEIVKELKMIMAE